MTNPAESPLALVTGATKGIGLAVSQRLLRGGTRVLGVYGHDEEAASAAGKECGGNLRLVRADLSEIDGIRPIAEAVENAGGLRFLVANIGLTDRVPFAATTPENWEKVLRANLTVPFFLVQRLAHLLPDRLGRIVFIGAAMGVYPHAISYAYSASKAGLHFLAKCLVKELSPRGVTVNVVAPGFVETSMQAAKARDHRERVERRISMGRFADPDEIAQAVESLLSQGYITGQVLGIDGGYDYV